MSCLVYASNGTVRNDCHRFVTEVLSLFTSVCRSEVHGGSGVLLVTKLLMPARLLEAEQVTCGRSRNSLSLKGEERWGGSSVCCVVW